MFATMKAVVVTARGKTDLKDVPVPSPAAGEILVKVRPRSRRSALSLALY